MSASEAEVRTALVDFLKTITKILKVVEPLIQKATEEELDKGVKL
jgi:hypothetical protein